MMTLTASCRASRSERAKLLVVSAYHRSRGGRKPALASRREEAWLLAAEQNDRFPRQQTSACHGGAEVERKR